jgi:dihydrofolate reductase
MGHHLIMGRRTFESIGRALPGRTSIVLSRNPAYTAEGVQTAQSLDLALSAAEASGEREAFVIGGGEIFTLALPRADRIYLTRVHTHGACDVFFPSIQLNEWELLASEPHPADGRNEFSFTYQVFEKIKRA